MTFIQDTLISFHREITPTLRNWYYILFGIIQPLLYLGLFVPLLTSVPTGTDGNPLQWFVPGMIVMLVLFTTVSCGWALTEELMSGSFERFLATPMNRSAILVGRSLKELAPLLVQAVIIIAVAAPFGLALHLLPMLLGLILLLVFGIGIASLSYALAIASKHDGGLFYMVSHSVALPLMLLGGVLLPMELAPDWLYMASRFNPLTYLVEAERALFTGVVFTPSVLYGALMAIAVALVGLMLGTLTIRKASL
ncbi:ABC transporter permease [Alkalimonas collagenimarina]|uniref:Transport permease protein n=1 Tax=Alkalimonas collagenimarina TaxID=400390 RepID=A0ABT9GUL5_9GAMM|nr:ABC transporter permease [Alkalimonas collagenimarina]MDP4534741.1 ABC transporter permease [Alkalimonas collagenimarina]